jgi:hypothetical protein
MKLGIIFYEKMVRWLYWVKKSITQTPTNVKHFIRLHHRKLCIPFLIVYFNSVFLYLLNKDLPLPAHFVRENYFHGQRKYNLLEFGPAEHPLSQTLMIIQET